MENNTSMTFYIIYHNLIENRNEQQYVIMLSKLIEQNVIEQFVNINNIKPLIFNLRSEKLLFSYKITLLIYVKSELAIKILDMFDANNKHCDLYFIINKKTEIDHYEKYIKSFNIINIPTQLDIQYAKFESIVSPNSPTNMKNYDVNSSTKYQEDHIIDDHVIDDHIIYNISTDEHINDVHVIIDVLNNIVTTIENIENIENDAIYTPIKNNKKEKKQISDSWYFETRIEIINRFCLLRDYFGLKHLQNFNIKNMTYDEICELSPRKIIKLYNKIIIKIKKGLKQYKQLCNDWHRLSKYIEW